MSDSSLRGNFPYFILVLVTALVITLSFGKPVFNLIKFYGFLLAVITVFPAFLFMIKVKRSEEFNQVLKGIVGGFFYKLLALLLGVWLAISRFELDTVNFVVSCLAFVFAFQVCESLYFWVKKDT